MTFKYNLDKIMDEKGISLNQLARETDLSINTIREVKNSPGKNVQIRTLKTLADALDCSIRDLIDDDPWNLYYQTLSTEMKKALSKINQLFSPSNIYFLQNSLSKIGITSNITRPTFLKSLSIESEPNKSPVFLNVYLQINQTDTINLEIINFDVYVNQNVLSELFIKRALIDVIELYATKNKIDYITFFNMAFETPDIYEHLGEPTTTFHSDPSIDKMILKSYNYKAYDAPLPLPKEDKWTKKVEKQTINKEINVRRNKTEI